jgi:hypothetical protein
MDLEVISKSGTAVVAHHRSKTPEPGAPYPVKPLDCSWFRAATNVDLLLKLADKCDRGMLCTAERLSARPSLKNEQPPKAVDVRVPVEWDPFSAMH